MEPEANSENNRVKVAFETLGCKLNQAETELLAGQLAEAGCIIVTAEEKPDIYILNTCTVTHIADRKSRHLLRMAHRLNPGARIIALGCYADRDAEGLSKIEGLEKAVGNKDKENLLQLLSESGYLKPDVAKPADIIHHRTRSFVKAQDGCNNFCTYCIVPVVRGREISLPPGQVIDNIRQKVSQSYQEIVLTGTEIGSYYHADLDLKGLLERILAETDVRRFRLSSLQPQEVTPDLLQLWQSPRLCCHFHLSLQSGSDTVLKRMQRRYRTTDYAEKINLINSAIPGVAITTDIITGFPGETDEESEESYRFCRRMNFARIHVFPYSPREGTEAARMPGQIEPHLKKQRSEKLLALAKSSLSAFQRRFIGQTVDVLFEQAAGGVCSGLTSNYIKVHVKTRLELTNRLLPVKLIALKGERMEGEL